MPDGDTGRMETPAPPSSSSAPELVEGEPRIGGDVAAFALSDEPIPLPLFKFSGSDAKRLIGAVVGE